MEKMHHVVQSSGGIGSWATAVIVQEEVMRPGDTLTLLFADVLAEDNDLYRFNADVERDLGVKLTVVSDGRTPQQALRDSRYLGNSRVAPCSHLLKQNVCRAWLTENCDPGDTILYVGIDWSEQHRLPAIRRNWSPWRVEAPLADPPYRDKQEMIAWARGRGLVEPRLYSLGFAHNNCGGACVRGGQAAWANLLRVFPDRFASWERFEREMQAELGSRVAILRDRTGGTTKPLPLTVLRERIEGNGSAAYDEHDWGGCGCMVEVPE